jgi:branched-chain amino acid transport system ATP-binding protein
VEALKVDRIAKDFGGVRALRNISFQVELGERLAIIGPNGAGKTTLFNIINGQISPTAGSVYFVGKDITHMPVHRRADLGIARSFQRSSLFPNLTVMSNILLAVQGTRKHRFQMFRSANAYQETFTRAEELLRVWDLWKERDSLADSISYGDQRKLEISLSLASQPKVLLMDEPSCGLTSSETAAVIEKIRGLAKDITVILVAHDMDLVFGVADRIMVLHYGEVVTEGSPEEIQNDAHVKKIYMGAEKSLQHAETA